MKNVALIFAGGTGTRFNAASVPKQFLLLSGKPVIIHTLEYFQFCGKIDLICVVCLEDKIDELNSMMTRYGITKAAIVVPGGSSGQESIFKGLTAIHENVSDPDTLVLIHDGVRPLISEELILNCISCARENGNAITVTKAYETIMTAENGGVIDHIVDRQNARLVRAPQCFFLNDIYSAHLRARSENYTGAIDSATLMNHYGMALHTVDGPVENIKITTSSDFFMARAIFESRENSQIGGL